MKKFLLILLQISLFATALPAFASDDPGFILSDHDLTDANVPAGFSQQFLDSRGGGLAKMTFQDIDGSMKKPGDLIDYYGKIYSVNPRFLLALIQKEQSLVYNISPTRCQIDWAAGYGRPDGSTCDDPSWQRYRGFTSQIVNAAAFVRFFYDKEASGEGRTFGYNPGVVATIDGQQIVPANTASALLYTYTPHLHGNLNLRTIWSNWFSMGYPDGTVLATADGTAYLIQGGMKRRFANKSAFKTRVDPSRVIPASDTALSGFEEGAPIKFADYSLVRVPDGTVYLLVGDHKRPIASMDVFRSIGFNPEEIDDVTAEDVEPYVEGDLITIKSAYPTGTLLQDSKTGGVYFVENGKKYPIVSKEIMKVNYPDKKISKVSAATLAKYETAAPAKFRDGELITSPGSNKAVYVVSNGMRRPIVSGAAFEQLGYSWKRVIWTSDEAVNLHPLGEPVNATPPAAAASQVALAP